MGGGTVSRSRGLDNYFFLLETHQYVTKKAQRNAVGQIREKNLPEIDFSNLTKWEEEPYKMGGGTVSRSRGLDNQFL